MYNLLIQIGPDEPFTSACLPDGREVSRKKSVFEALADCRRSGDCSDACEYVRDVVGVEWRIVARNDAGKYENRLATADEKAATARAIYFESSADFDDELTVESYLIWDAAAEFDT